MKKLNAFHLKLIACALMVLDHVGVFFPPEVAMVLHWVSRPSAVIFAYLVVEGAHKTSDLRRYNLRMLLAATAMFAGNAIINAFAQASFSEVNVSNNIFLTLFFGLLGITLFMQAEGQPGFERLMWTFLGFLPLLLCTALMMTLGYWVEGFEYLLPFMYTVHLARNKKALRGVLYALIAIVTFALRTGLYATLLTSQAGASLLPLPALGPRGWAAMATLAALDGSYLFLLALPIIGLYNGERGPQGRFAKYFFYAFYPLHIWVIALIRILIS